MEADSVCAYMCVKPSFIHYKKDTSLPFFLSLFLNDVLCMKGLIGESQGPVRLSFMDCQVSTFIVSFNSDWQLLEVHPHLIFLLENCSLSAYYLSTISVS